MPASNKLVPGQWRDGLDRSYTKPIVDENEKRHRAGFALYPPNTTVLELAALLDLYDDAYRELYEELNSQSQVAKAKAK